MESWTDSALQKRGTQVALDIPGKCPTCAFTWAIFSQPIYCLVGIQLVRDQSCRTLQMTFHFAGLSLRYPIFRQLAHYTPAPAKIVLVFLKSCTMYDKKARPGVRFGGRSPFFGCYHPSPASAPSKCHMTFREDHSVPLACPPTSDVTRSRLMSRLAGYDSSR